MEPVVVSILKELLDTLAIPYVEVTQSELAGQVIFSIRTENQSSTMLDAHTDTLHALDHLVKKIVEKRLAATRNVLETPESPVSTNFVIDINENRIRQIRELQDKAVVMAERARSLQYDVELTPMSAYERLIIHTTLQDAPNVKTESQGEGRERRVVIKYAA